MKLYYPIAELQRVQFKEIDMKNFERMWHSGKWDTPHPGNPETPKVFAKRIYRETLKWVLKNGKPYYDIEDEKVVATDSDIIYKELEATE